GSGGYIVVNNTNGSPSGFLLNLQAAATPVFTVDAAGNVSASGNVNIATGKQYQVNGSQISSSNLSDGGNLAKLNAANTFTNTNLIQLNSATAFQVQNSSNQAVLGVDTSNSRIFTGIPNGATAIGFTLNTPSYTTA